MSVNGRVKMKTMTENITGAGGMQIVYLLHNVQFYRFRTSAWTAENASKRLSGRESIDAFSMTTKTHIFENVFICVDRV